MSSKNFMAYGDAETVLTGFANKINGKAKTYILNTESTDESSATYIPLANISNLPTCNVGDIIVLKVNANYTFNKNVGGRWKFKINGIGRVISLLWADESDFNQDLPKGSCVVFVYNNTTVLGNFFTVISFDVKNFDPSTVVQKSQTAGLLKNDGTVDTTTYASEAGTESLINSTVGWTGKNELENSGTNTSIQTVVITANSDGSITLNGTATASNASYVIGHYTIKAGTHILSKTGVSNLKFQVTDYPVTTELYLAEMNDVTMTFAQDTAIAVRLSLISGTQYNNVTVYPMIRLATVTDPTYEPYHKSVEECLEEINDKLSYLEQTVTLSTSTSTAVTFTDSSITANSFIEYACSQWDLVPESITGAAGSCTIVLPKVDSAQSVTVRIYVR